MFSHPTQVKLTPFKDFLFSMTVWIDLIMIKMFAAYSIMKLRGVLFTLKSDLVTLIMINEMIDGTVIKRLKSHYFPFGKGLFAKPSC